jgi:hypothetical protein
MHSAPAVSFPVGRSRFQGYLIGALMACGVVTVATWCWQADAMGWRQWFAVAMCLITSGLAGWHWWHTPKGSLTWDSAAWCWTVGEQSWVVVPEVVMDLQQLVLLRLGATGGTRATWVLLDRELHPSRWLALRRAIYTRVRGTGDLMADVASPPVDAVRHVS